MANSLNLRLGTTASVVEATQITEKVFYSSHNTFLPTNFACIKAVLYDIKPVVKNNTSMYTAQINIKKKKTTTTFVSILKGDVSLGHLFSIKR